MLYIAKLYAFPGFFKLELIEPHYVARKGLLVSDCSDGYLKARLQLRCSKSAADKLEDGAIVRLDTANVGFSKFFK